MNRGDGQTGWGTIVTASDPESCGEFAHVKMGKSSAHSQKFTVNGENAQRINEDDDILENDDMNQIDRMEIHDNAQGVAKRGAIKNENR
uniref:Uncharacterized protein n=1 Tax=Romanomermis culicivorax TaxID=13658 RepID=A0A915JLS0_ROMCU